MEWIWMKTEQYSVNIETETEYRIWQFLYSSAGWVCADALTYETKSRHE